MGYYDLIEFCSQIINSSRTQLECDFCPRKNEHVDIQIPKN